MTVEWFYTEQELAGLAQTVAELSAPLSEGTRSEWLFIRDDGRAVHSGFVGCAQYAQLQAQFLANMRDETVHAWRVGMSGKRITAKPNGVGAMQRRHAEARALCTRKAASSSPAAPKGVWGYT